MKTWLFIQIIIDIFLFSLLFVYLFQIKKRIAAHETSQSDIDIEKLMTMFESMNALVEESEKISEKFIDTIKTKQTDINAQLEKLESEKQGLESLLKEARNSNALYKNFDLSSIQSTEKYSRVAPLIKKGLSVDGIAKETGLSKGEIELIKNIRK